MVLFDSYSIFFFFVNMPQMKICMKKKTKVKSLTESPYIRVLPGLALVGNVWERSKKQKTVTAADEGIKKQKAKRMTENVTEKLSDLRCKTNEDYRRETLVQRPTGVCSHVSQASVIICRRRHFQDTLSILFH